MGGGEGLPKIGVEDLRINLERVDHGFQGDCNVRGKRHGTYHKKSEPLMKKLKCNLEGLTWMVCGALVAACLAMIPIPAHAACQTGLANVIGITRDIYIPFNQAGTKTTNVTYYTDESRGYTCAVAVYTMAIGVKINGSNANKVTPIGSIGIGATFPHALTLDVPRGFSQSQLTVQILEVQSDVFELSDTHRIGSFNIFIGTEALTNYAWVHTATASNTNANSTKIQSAEGFGAWYLQYRPTARVLVTPRLAQTNPVFNPHPIGVWYDGTDWNIYNEDGAAMELGAQFNVRPDGFDIAGDNPIHTNTTTNTFLNFSLFNEVFVPWVASTMVTLTHNWNPPEAEGSRVLLPHNLGVWFNGSVWSVFNQDMASMPVNAKFNLRSFGYQGEGAFIHTATSANTSGSFTTIDNVDTNHQPNAILIVTPNWNPIGAPATYYDVPYGVQWNGTGWTVRSLDGQSIPLGASFNVYVPKPPI